MNIAKKITRGAIRPLTAKQQHFVCAILQGRSRSDAFRYAYRNDLSSHDVSIRAWRAAKSAAVQRALEEAKTGNFSALIICREEAELLGLRKISNDPSAPSYVRLGALNAILEHRRANPEPEPPKKPETKKPETIEEIERFLRAVCGQKPGARRQNGFDAADVDEIPDLDLD
jgi:integrase